MIIIKQININSYTSLVVTSKDIASMLTNRVEI